MDFLDDEPTPEERRAALIQALKTRMGVPQQAQQQQPQAADFYRGQGNLALQSGDRVLGNFGQAQVGQAQNMDTLAESAKQRALGQVLEASRMDSTEKHQQAMEELQRQQLEQGKYTLSNPGYGQTYLVNGKNGKVMPIGDSRERPPSGAGTSAENKMWKDFSDSISTVKGRANLNAENQKRLFASERVKALAQGPDGQPVDLTPQQLTELAAASGALISNGSPTEHTIQSMMPRGMGLGTAKFQEWLLNEPTGAGQKAFVKLMIDQANREEKLIHGQMLKGQTQALPNYNHLRGKDKVRFDSMLQAAGIDPEQIDERGLLAQPESGVAAGDADQQAIAWAKANPKDPDAAAILKLHGIAP